MLRFESLQMTLDEAYIFILVLPFPVALLWAMLSDARRFEIPNLVPVILLVGYLVAAVGLQSELHIVLRQLAIGFVALLIGMAMFTLRIVGGGDVKLLASCLPWLAPLQMPVFLFWMAFTGGILSLCALLIRHKFSGTSLDQTAWLKRVCDEKKIPYGVAIGCAGLITLPGIPFFNN